MKKTLIGMAVIGLLSGSGAAQASTLIGATVSIQDYFDGVAHTPSGGPGGGGPYTITSADTATTDQFDYGDGHWDASFTSTQVVFTFNSAVTYNTGTGAYTTGAISIYDGPLVTFNEALASVTEDSSTTATNFKISDITENLSAGQIGVSWQGQAFAAGQKIVLDVTPVNSPMPEASSYALMLAGIAGVGILLRKHRNG